MCFLAGVQAWMAPEPWQAVCATYRPHGFASSSSELRGSHRGQWRYGLALEEDTCEITFISEFVSGCDGVFGATHGCLWVIPGSVGAALCAGAVCVSPAGTRCSRPAAHSRAESRNVLVGGG